jgi:hypothetical protein
MADDFSVTVDTTGTRQQLAVLTGLAGIPPDGWRDIGIYIQKGILFPTFKTQGARFGGWRQLGLTRQATRTPKSKKYTTIDEVLHRNSKALIDTGKLQESFTMDAAAGAVFRITDTTNGRKLEVGSALPYAATHNDGTSLWRFRFTAKEHINFEGNIRAVLPGKKPQGAFWQRMAHMRVAKENWNPDYFILHNWLHKKTVMDDIVVPRRQIVPDSLSPTEHARIESIAEKAIADGIRKEIGH